MLPDEAIDVESGIRRGLSPSDARSLAKAAEWTMSYPIQRVRKGHRTEAICPMVAPSISAGAMRFAMDSEGDTGDLDCLDSALRRAAERFHEIPGGDDPRLRCLVLVMPRVKGQRLLEATHPDRSIKAELLARGILAGEFFPTCPFATTFNRRLHALRSPVTMVVLRTFIEGDWRFICRVPAWQRIYRDRFGEPPPRLRHLGGFWWRLKDRIVWKLDTLLGRSMPVNESGGGDEQP